MFLDWQQGVSSWNDEIDEGFGFSDKPGAKTMDLQTQAISYKNDDSSLLDDRAHRWWRLLFRVDCSFENGGYLLAEQETAEGGEYEIKDHLFYLPSMICWLVMSG